MRDFVRQRAAQVLLVFGVLVFILDSYGGCITRENSRIQRQIIMDELKVAVQERAELKRMLEELLRRMPAK